jgi:signal transduction histidine kinase
MSPARPRRRPPPARAPAAGGRPSGPGRRSLAELCRLLQQGSDEERARLARSLHDSAAQTLAAAAMNLSLLEGEAPALSPPAARALAEAQALLAATSGELRGLAHALHPPLLATAGLEAALRELGRRSDGRLALSLSPGPWPRLSPALELGAYRLIEEAAGGAFQAAPPVVVTAACEEGGGLEVRLEGRPQAGAAGALAQLALRERARAVSGRLRLRARPGRLVITVRLGGR